MVRVATTSVNMVDTMIRGMGKDLPLSPDLPAVLGMDFAGTIEAASERATGFAPEDSPICKARSPNICWPMPS